ncbi:MAG TPA: hypothetical protein VGF18_06555, partial [Candidatus Tumulicola sp.]
MFGHRVFVIVFAIAVSGCSTPSASVPSPGIAHSAASTDGAFQIPPGYLYVSANTGLLVYAGTKLKFLRNAGGTQPAGLAVDGVKQVYNADTASANVRIFSPGAAGTVRTLSRHLVSPTNIALSSNGDAYVVASDATVAMFVNATNKKSRTVKKLSQPVVAVDASGNAYVGSGNTIYVLPPRSTKPIRTIGGLNGVVSEAFDASGNLYVGNAAGSGTGGSVSVFAPGASTPSYSITNGIDRPGALAFDSHEDLYVANELAGTSGDVTEYVPGSMTPRATVTSYVDDPTSICLDSNDNLYVADAGTHNVTVYAVKSFVLDQEVPTKGDPTNVL